MMIRVTKTQSAAIETIAADSKAPGVKGVTLDALEAKGLVIARDNGGASLDWYLTAQARLLVSEITEAPADGPQQPADPFDLIPGNGY
jgi:hypothetical protein